MERAHIRNDGMGGFLNPPTHPEHYYSVETTSSSMCLTSAATDECLRPKVRAAAIKMLADWRKPNLCDVQEWVYQVLGYFRNCYKGTGDHPWNAGNLTITPIHPDGVEAHAGVHLIRKYYPDFQPTARQFNRAYWGTKR